MIFELFYTRDTCALATPIALVDAGAKVSFHRLDIDAQQQHETQYPSSRNQACKRKVVVSLPMMNGPDVLTRIEATSYWQRFLSIRAGNPALRSSFLN